MSIEPLKNGIKMQEKWWLGCNSHNSVKIMIFRINFFLNFLDSQIENELSREEIGLNMIFGEFFLKMH